MEMVAAAWKLGLDVPTDLSVITFDNEVTNDSRIAVDRMLIRYDEMAHRAVRELLALIDDPKSPRPPAVIPLDYQSMGTISRPAAVRPFNERTGTMTRLVTMGMLALLIVSSAQATQLLTDQMNYSDDAALRAVWKADYDRTTDTAWTYNASGLSFANHFASAGGAAQSPGSAQAFADLDASVQICGAYGEDSWKGQSFTFYSSHLVNAASVATWWIGTTGAAIRVTGDSGTEGFGAGFGQTSPDSDNFESNISVGDDVDGKWNASESYVFSGGTTMANDTTYLVLAKYVYTNPNASGSYNPWIGSGTLTGSLAVFTEADAYPTDEASITWDVVETRDNNPRAADLTVLMASLNSGAVSTSGDGVRIDELRIGTEYGDVMAVPEPTTMSLLALGGVAALIRRRK